MFFNQISYWKNVVEIALINRTYWKSKCRHQLIVKLIAIGYYKIWLTIHNLPTLALRLFILVVLDIILPFNHLVSGHLSGSISEEHRIERRVQSVEQRGARSRDLTTCLSFTPLQEVRSKFCLVVTGSAIASRLYNIFFCSWNVALTKHPHSSEQVLPTPKAKDIPRRMNLDCQGVGEGNFRTWGEQVLPMSKSESEAEDTTWMDDLRSGILGDEESGPGVEGESVRRAAKSALYISPKQTLV